MGTALAFPALVAMCSGVLALADADELNASTAAVVLVPVAAFGAVVAKGWVLALPIFWSALYLAVLRIADLVTGECSVCTSDENWGNYPAFFFVIAVVPMTAALSIGVMLGMVARRRARSRRGSGSQLHPRA